MNISPVRFLSSSHSGAPASIELAATLYRPHPQEEERYAGLVVGHGAGSRRTSHDEFCRASCAAGFVVLALDFRGHGDSAGRADGPLEQDIIAAARYLRTHREIEVGELCYRGSSMGGFYGLKAAPEAGFAALALLCPAAETVILDVLDREEAVEKYANELNATRWDGAALRRYFRAQDSLRLASRVTCPVLLLHARGDDVVPFEHSLRLTAALRGQTTLLAFPGGTHTTAQHDPAVHGYTVQWLHTQLM